MKFEPDLNYLGWQKRLRESSLFRRWWQFWSNYAFIFFIAAAVGTSQHPERVKIFILSTVSFFFARVIVTTLINHFFHRVRPYQKLKFSPITSRFFSFKTNIPNSFPSRHTTSFTSVAVVVFLFNPILGTCLLVATIMTGIGRVILGYHYPSDIVGGLFLGTLIGVLTVYLARGLTFT